MSQKFIRKSNRLSNKIFYESNNQYFVTICVQDKLCIFDTTLSLGANLLHYQLDNKTVITQIIVGWLCSAESIYEGIYLDNWVIMPNHIHAIIVFGDNPTQKNIQKSVTLGDVVSRFKNDTRRNIAKYVEEGLSLQNTNTNASSLQNTNTNASSLQNTNTNASSLQNGETGNILQNGETGSPLHGHFNHHKIWQKSFYDHIIRDEEDLIRVQEYIKNNPIKWELDELYNPI